MKTAIIIFVSLITLASCIKEDVSNCPRPVADRSNVEFTFIQAGGESRAFFDNNATAETWEKTLSSLTIYVFSETGDLVAERFFTTAELSARKATMALPLTMTDKTCDFYAVANSTLSGINKKSDLTSKMENRPSDYNGTFANVSTKSVRTAGFVMTGTTSKKVGGVGSTTSVEITLKRMVAKIALQTTVSESFGQKYGGTLKVTDVILTGAATQTNYFYNSVLSTGAMTYTHTQPVGISANKFNSLFYIYENGNLAAGSRVTLEIKAIYDADGNETTVNDRKEVSYFVELAGTGTTGKIERNGYYRIAVAISGLAGEELDLSVSIADWETPATQNINIGL